jgi:hypothetical protein
MANLRVPLGDHCGWTSVANQMAPLNNAPLRHSEADWPRW